MKLTAVLPLVTLVVQVNCTSPERLREEKLNAVADQYVSLALEIGRYDDDFIDAYYGPLAWHRNSKNGEGLPYEELKWKGTKLFNELKSLNNLEFSELELLRYRYLTRQVESLRTKLDIMSGKGLPFDVESLRLYDVVAPQVSLANYDTLLTKLDQLVPGTGNLAARYKAYARNFIIPADKVDTVFKTAIIAARNKVTKHINLPENESFELQYVNDQPWSAYNWFKGNGHSVIQINTDFPIYIERAIDLACHEGYPGHHVYNVMLEKAMVIDHQWLEFQVYPLFSPQSFIAEGTATYGTKMIFNEAERIKFEAEILFPLAGLDPREAEKYYQVQAIRRSLLSAQIQIARDYLNGQSGVDETVERLHKYLQYEESRARQRVRFFDRYRSYIVNYTLGEEMVEAHLNAGIEGDNKSRWELYQELLTTPRTASGLQAN